MEKNINKKILKLNEEIKGLKVDEPIKVYLLQIIKYLILAPKGRIYIKDLDDFKEYLSLKIQNGSNNIQICVTEKMVEYSGATGGRDNKFLSYPELIEYISKNKEIIDSQLKAIEYYTEQKENSKEETMSDSITEIVRKKIEQMPGSQTKKARVFAVLDLLANEPGKKIYSIKKQEFEECLTIINNSIYIIQKMVDYAGVKQGRRKFIITSDKLLDYIEEHKDEIDKSLEAKRTRRK